MDDIDGRGIEILSDFDDALPRSTGQLSGNSDGPYSMTSYNDIHFVQL